MAVLQPYGIFGKEAFYEKVFYMDTAGFNTYRLPQY